MIQKLRHRFILLTMSIFTIMLLLLFATLLHLTQQRFQRDNLQMMERAVGRPFGSPPRPTEKRDDSDSPRLPFFVLRINTEGDIMETFGDYFDLSDTASLLEMTDIALHHPKDIGIIRSLQLRFLRRYSEEGDLTLVFSDISLELMAMRNLQITCLIIAVIALVGFFFLSLTLSRWMTTPIDLAWRQQKQFVSDASHELKTPLTIILTNAELLRENVQLIYSSQRDFSPAALPDTLFERPLTNIRKYTENILTSSQEMRALTESLLELARVENGSIEALVLSEVNLSQILENALLSFEALFFEQGLVLESEVPPMLSLRGSSAHLKRLVDILLDNAQKYAYPGTTVTVTLRKTDKRLHLTVSDQGDPIPPDRLETIFKRFYRLEESRSSAHSFGLGLSIAQSIVESHHGKIWAESKDGINSFHVTLPVTL